MYSTTYMGERGYQTGSMVDAFLNDDYYPIRSSRPVMDFPAHRTGNKPSGIFQSLFRPKRSHPKRTKGEVRWSSTFMRTVGGVFRMLSNPIGFAFKLVSLLLLPLFFAAFAFGFLHFYMHQGRVFSGAFAVAFYAAALWISKICVSDRPKGKEVLEIFGHEVGIQWLGFCVGNTTYCLLRANGNDPDTSLYIALGALAIAGYLTYPLVAFRKGARHLVKYIYQVAGVVGTTGLFLAVGYALAPTIWQYFFAETADFFRSSAVATCFGFAGFWSGLSLFLIPDHGYLRDGERGDGIKIVE